MGSRHRAPVTALIASWLILACGGGAPEVDDDKAGGDAAAEAVVLTLASVQAGLPPPIGSFMDEVERLAGGTIRVELRERWRQGEPEQEVGLIEDVQAGDVDLAWVGARAFDSVGVTTFQALVAPFLIDSYELQDRVFSAGIPERMLQGISEIGLTGIGVLPGPLRKLTGKSRAFTAPADFAGATIGTSGGELAEQTFRALEATPKMVPSETPFAGFDALDYQLSAVYGNRHFDVARYVTANVNLWPRPLALFMNADAFADLSPQHQDILRRAASDAFEAAAVETRREQSEAAIGLCGVGMEVVEASDVELAALQEAVAPVYADLEADASTRRFLDEIRALKADATEPLDSFSCPDATTVAEIASPLDGVYRMTTTADELRAAGDPMPIAENYGEWVVVFDGVRLVSTIESTDACTWAYATVSVDGDRVEWTIIDGGGIAPNNAMLKPGERFTYEWSLFRDQLTLSAVPGVVGPPAPFKPLTRTTEKPSLDLFPDRCRPPDEALPGIAGGTVAPLDGTWEISVTRDELAAAGASAEQLEEPNLRGTWQLTLADGQFSFSDPSRGTVSDRGTYVVDGDELILTHDQHGDGLVLHVRWSQYRDALTFALLPDSDPVSIFLVADTWRRVE